MTHPATAHRVVWILDALQPGGAERLALRFAATAPPAWEVNIIALRPAPGGGDLGRIWGPELGPAAAAARQLHMRSLRDAGAWCGLVGALRRLRPELVHTHLRYATVWGGAAARWLGVPHVTTVHLGPSPEPSRRQAWAARLERASRRRAARVVYVSEAQRAAWDTRAERAVVIGNGVAPPNAPPGEGEAPAAARHARGLPAQAFVLTTVAVVRARKGWRSWLEAVEQMAPALPHARFVWVGGGPEFAAFQAAAAASRWAAQIHLAGPRTDVGTWLRLSDVFLFPSLEEAQPTAVMEAMAAALPVVATALPAIAEVLGGSGILVPPGDAAALAQAAVELSGAAADAVRRRMGEAASQRARDHYSEPAWRQRLLGLYREVLDEHKDEKCAARTRHSDGRVLCSWRRGAL